MKKTVKFSGMECDSIIYFTGIFIPKDKERVEKLFALLNLAIQLGGESHEGVFQQEIGNSVKRYSKVESNVDGIILRIRYEKISSGSDVERAKRDSDALTEQIETLITALEGE